MGPRAVIPKKDMLLDMMYVEFLNVGERGPQKSEEEKLRYNSGCFWK